MRMKTAQFSLVRRRPSALWLALGLALAATVCRADKLVLRIRAANRADEVQTVQVRSNLPARAGTNDVISLGGLQLGYDVQNDVYYVHGEVELGPREIRVYDVEMRDVWVVDAAGLDAIEAHARDLAGKLAGGDAAENGAGLLAEIEKNLAAVRQLQDENAISRGVRPIQHIRAYEENLETLKRVRTDLGYLENLVLGAGRDVGELMGDVKEAPLPEGVPSLPAGDYQTAVIRISVRNTSPRETREGVPVERNLPAEIELQDVLDAGELEVGVRPGTGTVYVHTRIEQLGPGESKTFEVRIRDRWNTTAVRVADLRRRTDDLRQRTGSLDKYAAVGEALGRIREELAALEAAEGPAEVDDAYVAFYRRQAGELNRIEQRIARIETALRPVDRSTRYGFGNVKPPTMKTTWMIIYVILGFLALVSLLFFLRWYGKGK